MIISVRALSVGIRVLLISALLSVVPAVSQAQTTIVATSGTTLDTQTGQQVPCNFEGTNVPWEFSFSISMPYTNVSIAETFLAVSSGFTATAYLTTAIGPGTTAAQQIASAPVVIPPSVPVNTMTNGLSMPAPPPVVLFSGLNLNPGTYYVTINPTSVPVNPTFTVVIVALASPTPQCSYNVTAAPGATNNLPDSLASFTAAYPPASDFNLPNGFGEVFVYQVVAVAVASDAFQVRYGADLNIGDSVINVTNTGASTAAVPTGTVGAGNLCVNAYVFDQSEELLACCTCFVTPNGLASFSAKNQLISNNLTPEIPNSIVIKLLATTPATGATSAVGCNPGGTITGANLASGMAAWGTTLHALPTTPTTYGVTETPFTISALSQGELNHLTSYCSFIQSNASGFGICKGCSVGGLGTRSAQ